MLIEQLVMQQQDNQTLITLKISQQVFTMYNSSETLNS